MLARGSKALGTARACGGGRVHRPREAARTQVQTQAPGGRRGHTRRASRPGGVALPPGAARGTWGTGAGGGDPGLRRGRGRRIRRGWKSILENRAVWSRRGVLALRARRAGEEGGLGHAASR